MSTKKSPKKSPKKQAFSSDLIDKLKKAGFKTDVKKSRTGKYSTTERAKILRAWAKYGSVANNKGDYVVRNIKKYNGGRRKILKDAGYLIYNDKIYIPKHKAEKISLKATNIKGIGYGIELEREFSKTGKKERQFMYRETGGGKSWKEKILERANKMKFNKDEFYGAKFENGPVFTFIRLNMNDFMKYFTERATYGPDNLDPLPESKLNKVRLVKITVKHFEDLAAEQMTTKNYRKGRAKKKSMRKVNAKGRNA